MFKKGISPVISVVLLVAFAVTLFLVFSNFVSENVENTSKKFEGTLASNVECGTSKVVVLDYDFVDVDTLDLLIENRGTKNLDNIFIRVVGFDDVEFFELDINLKILEIFDDEVNFDFTKTGAVEKIEVYPMLKDGICKQGVDLIDLSEGLIAFYRFENDVKNIVGIGDGKISGDPQFVDGVVEKALRFDGLDDYLAIQDLYYKAGDKIPVLTVSAWVKTSFQGSSLSDNWAIVDFDRSDYYNLYVRGDNGRVGFSTVDNTGDISDVIGSAVVNDGEWHFITAVYDGVNKIIYVDGVEDNRIANVHSGLAIGRERLIRYGFIGDGSEATSFDGGRNEFYYEGDIDELRIYHRALNGNEVENLYRQK